MCDISLLKQTQNLSVSEIMLTVVNKWTFKYCYIGRDKG